ncbi:MAG: hypothetical protein HRU07_06685 [Nitrosopumilus sp.]|nr:hypothetical protein [Nitrosopumilus sp.]NRA05827.1 hypothetical protein [Nitrosopumilus sp.]
MSEPSVCSTLADICSMMSESITSTMFGNLLDADYCVGNLATDEFTIFANSLIWLIVEPCKNLRCSSIIFSSTPWTLEACRIVLIFSSFTS